MKLRNDNTEVVSSGTKGGSEFRIKATAKAFRILSDNLYSNKIRAFIRELSTNASDSHILAKQSKPFTVTLPSEFDSVFKVRDYGVGLSHDEVINIYTTYFESTKDTSDDFAGALGLGSKSPFAYVDTFSVTAWKNGIKNVYTIFINGNGTPEHQLMWTGESDEESGVLVEVGIQRTDRNRVHETAYDVLQWFDCEIEVINGRGPVQKYKELFLLGPGDIYYRSNNLIAKQGPVAYPISKSQLDSALNAKLDVEPEENVDERQNLRQQILHLQVLLSRGAVLEFNMGSLDIMPSREELSYDPDTVNTLIRAIDAACMYIISSECDRIESDLKELSGFSREKYLLKIFLNQGTMEKLYKTSLIGRGITSIYCDSKGQYKTSTNMDSIPLGKILSVSKKGNGITARSKLIFNDVRGSAFMQTYHGETSFPVFILNDLCNLTDASKVLRRYIYNSGSYARIYMIQDAEDQAVQHFLSVNMIGAQDYPILKLSELNKTLPKFTTARNISDRKLPRVGRIIISKNSTPVSSGLYEFNDIDFDNTVPYILIDSDNRLMTGAGKFKVSNGRDVICDDMVKILRGLNEITPYAKIYLLREAHVKKFKKDGVNLVSVITDFESKIEQHTEYLTNYLLSSKLKGNYLSSSPDLQDTMFIKIYKTKVAYADTIALALKQYQSVLVTCLEKVELVYKQFSDRYPMLDEIFKSSSYYSLDKGRVLQYVRMVEGIPEISKEEVI